MLEPNVGACVWMCSTRVGKGALGVVCVTLRKWLNIALFSKLNPQPFHRRSSTVIKDKLENWEAFCASPKVLSLTNFCSGPWTFWGDLRGKIERDSNWNILSNHWPGFLIQTHDRIYLFGPTQRLDHPYMLHIEFCLWVPCIPSLDFGKWPPHSPFEVGVVGGFFLNTYRRGESRLTPGRKKF